MTANIYGSVDLQTGDEPAPGELSENLHCHSFPNERSGRLRVGALNVGNVTIGDVTSNGYDAATESARIALVLPTLGRINSKADKVDIESCGAGALLSQPGGRRSRVRPDCNGQFRMMAAIVPVPPGRPTKTTDLPAILLIGSTSEARSLRGFMDYAFAEANKADSALLRPVALKAAGALVVDIVHAVYGRVLPAKTILPSASRVRAAEQYIRAHAEEALTVEEVAHAVGVGPRALQAAFRASHGATSRQLLAEIRLENARARLLAPNAGMTVTDAALASGFAHLGRFAVAYRQRFGESPSKTLKRTLR